jgi:hypothetical protein
LCVFIAHSGTAGLKISSTNTGRERLRDLLRVLLHHDVAVDEDGAHDGEGKQGVAEHVDGNSEIIHYFLFNYSFN